MKSLCKLLVSLTLDDDSGVLGREEIEQIVHSKHIGRDALRLAIATLIMTDIEKLVAVFWQLCV